MISRCVIARDSSDFHGGGIYCRGYPSPTIENCTISGNFSFAGAGIFIWDSAPTIVNTIVEGCLEGGAIYFNSAANTSVTYSDFHDNDVTNFLGIGVPVGLGVISGVNANGDPCDDYQNIFLDPEFVDPVAGDYHLLAISPCIDAGNPASPPDPDGTIADIGAFYYDQGSVPNLTITLTPYNPPIQIPASGGSFDYNIAAENLGMSPTFTHVWCDVMLPNGSIYGPVLGPVQITMAAGISAERDRIQNVPAVAPEGTYAFNAYIGGYPDLIWDEDHFDFEKLATGDGIAINDWNSCGEDFGAWVPTAEPSGIPDVYTLEQSYPNPFNPSTTIGFSLPEASKVNLSIYDVSGRRVVTLINGWRNTGFHEITFNGSDLPSGVYIYSLTAASYTASGKMVLLK